MVSYWLWLLLLALVKHMRNFIDMIFSARAYSIFAYFELYSNAPE